MPIAIPERNALVLNLRDHKPVTDLLPHQFIEHEGTQLIAVPHTLDAWRVLRNLGINVTGFEPLRSRYTSPRINGQYAPMPHQVATAAFLSCEFRAFCLSTPRTGKTAATLMAIDFLRQQKAIKSALVVAPNSCLRSVWEAEIFGMFPHWSVAVLQGDRATRCKLLARNFDVYIINPDGVKVVQSELTAAVEEKRIGAMVFDEVTDYANRTSARWVAANAVKKQVTYCWALTGTPGDPEDVYGQVRLINPSQVPSSFTTWRDMTMLKLGMFKWVPKVGHQELVAAAMQPAIRFDKKDLLDLPPLQFLDREATMSDEQMEAYERMRKTFLMASRGVAITAANAAVMNGKLLQIATGAVKTDDGGVITFDVKNRIEVLEQIISEAEYKVLIFAPYTAVIRELQRQLESKWSVSVVDGSVTGRKRDDIFRLFQTTPDPHILIAHPRTTSFGLELSAADTVVFWGPPVNGPFVYQQAVERINSIHQKSKSPSIVHLYASPAERAMFRSIKAGVGINEGIVNLFRQIIQEKAV